MAQVDKPVANRPPRILEREYDLAYGGGLAGSDTLDIVDIVIVGVIILLSGTLLISVAGDWPKWTVYLNIVLLGFVSFVVAYRRMVVRPDHVRASQSEQVLTIARESLSHLRAGLSPETATAVCEIILRETPTTAAVSITDLRHVLAFVGTGADHHLADIAPDPYLLMAEAHRHRVIIGPVTHQGLG